MKVTNLEQYLNSKIDKVKKAHTEALFEAVDYIVLWSPVDTGNFRANWQTDNGDNSSIMRIDWWGDDREMDESVIAGVPSYGYWFAMDRAIPDIEKSAGKHFTLANTAHYGGKLEDGFSPQSRAFTEMGYAKYKDLLQLRLKQ